MKPGGVVKACNASTWEVQGRIGKFTEQWESTHLISARPQAGSSAPQTSRPGSDTTGSYPTSTLSIAWLPGGEQRVVMDYLGILYFEDSVFRM